MSAEFESEANPLPKVDLKEYKRIHDRRRRQGIIQMTIKPTVAKKLKTFYEEYSLICQQNKYAIPEFHDFILQFSEIGFYSWRNGVKGR